MTKDFDLEEFLEANKNPLDDPMLAIGISAGIKVGFAKARELFEPTWISVEDSTPQIDDLIVYLMRKTGVTGTCLFDGTYQQYGFNKNVTHWMPLPQALKEQS